VIYIQLDGGHVGDPTLLTCYKIIKTTS